MLKTLVPPTPDRQSRERHFSPTESAVTTYGNDRAAISVGEMPSEYGSF